LKIITRILKTASNEDKVTLRAEDDGDHLVIVIESARLVSIFHHLRIFVMFALSQRGPRYLRMR